VSKSFPSALAANGRQTIGVKKLLFFNYFVTQHTDFVIEHFDNIAVFQSWQCRAVTTHPNDIPWMKRDKFGHTGDVVGKTENHGGSAVFSGKLAIHAYPDDLRHRVNTATHTS
jgi:hypothetical protein